VRRSNDNISFGKQSADSDTFEVLQASTTHLDEQKSIYYSVRDEVDPSLLQEFQKVVADRDIESPRVVMDNKKIISDKIVNNKSKFVNKRDHHQKNKENEIVGTHGGIDFVKICLQSDIENNEIENNTNFKVNQDN